ncbi:5-oxoprolinase subunit C family protein [Nocardioides pacificus]
MVEPVTGRRGARPRLVVRSVGGLCLVQDLGRPGQAAIGVGRSGAADRASYLLGNRMLANPPGAAALEVVLGGLEVLVAEQWAWVCVTGAPAPVSVDGRAVGSNRVVPVPPGAVLRLGTPPRGLRSYVAVRGGLDVPPVLGSRSHDVLAGLGPAPVAPGDVLPVGAPPPGHPVLDEVPVSGRDEDVLLRVVAGPRHDRVVDLDALTAVTWTAGAHSDRVGMRLLGGAITPAEGVAPLASEGALRGAVQVPPSGEPVVFLADHPVTGGYPVVAVVVDEDVDRAAQVRPGEQVRFTWARGR